VAVSANGTNPPPGAAGGLGVRGRSANNNEAAPMRVLALHPAGGTFARCVSIDGVLETVETALIGPLEAGAVVLVRAGIALARLDTEWAP
jgi:hydrogenase maturation factor